MSEQTTDETDAETDEIIIHVTEADLPSGEEREAIITEMEELIGETFHEYGRNPPYVQVESGHEFAGIPDECPECGETLQITNAEPQSGRSALADTQCPSCEYVGRATYWLTDLTPHTKTGNPGHSVVRNGTVQPDYRTY
jgi:predicted RNA-binding Zn-ribbon protein involved in translation (DUF1610 family)